MNASIIAVSTIHVENRKRPIDTATVAELKKSIEQQGLLQNIGVQETAAGYRLVFGAHRLEAMKALGRTEISALIFPEDTSEDECLLAELQENNARKELTGAERKAFAAEVGRLSTKLSEKYDNSRQYESDFDWFSDWRDKSGLPKNTAYDWWRAFTRDTGIELTPKQAGDAERKAFFDWLDAQKRAEDAEKARKAAEIEAEKQRRADEAKARRLESEMKDFMEYMDATAKEWGVETVKKWIAAWHLKVN